MGVPKRLLLGRLGIKYGGMPEVISARQVMHWPPHLPCGLRGNRVKGGPVSLWEILRVLELQCEKNSTSSAEDGFGGMSQSSGLLC